MRSEQNIGAVMLQGGTGYDRWCKSTVATVLDARAPRARLERPPAGCLASIALTFVLMGCGKPIRVYDVHDELAKWKEREESAFEVKKQGSITLRIHAAPTMGSSTGVFGAALGPLIPLESTEASDASRMLSQWIEQDPDAVGGILIKGIDEATQIILSRKLARYFQQVTVEIDRAPLTASTGGVTALSVGRDAWITHTAVYFSLSLTSNGARPVTYEAKPPPVELGGMWAWMTPLIVITLGGLTPVAKSLVMDQEKAKLIEAIDVTCTALADDLARQVAGRASRETATPRDTVRDPSKKQDRATPKGKHR